LKGELIQWLSFPCTFLYFLTSFITFRFLYWLEASREYLWESSSSVRPGTKRRITGYKRVRLNHDSKVVVTGQLGIEDPK
jgi:hypothetical protein